MLRFKDLHLGDGFFYFVPYEDPRDDGGCMLPHLRIDKPENSAVDLSCGVVRTLDPEEEIGKAKTWCSEPCETEFDIRLEADD